MLEMAKNVFSTRGYNAAVSALLNEGITLYEAEKIVNQLRNELISKEELELV